jgi:hydrogenase nickel incorporation protein HypA/HybF
MHELSIGQALIEQVEAAAVNEQAKRVVRVVIVIGALSGVEPGALRAVFPLVASGTVAEDAELLIECVEARVKCLACGHESVTDITFLGCTNCASREVELSAGRELNIKSIELETDDG